MLKKHRGKPHDYRTVLIIHVSLFCFTTLYTRSFFSISLFISLTVKFFFYLYHIGVFIKLDRGFPSSKCHINSFRNNIIIYKIEIRRAIGNIKFDILHGGLRFTILNCICGVFAHCIISIRPILTYWFSPNAQMCGAAQVRFFLRNFTTLLSRNGLSC